MQPAIAIPPYTEEGVQKLKGSRVRVPVLANPDKGWWVEITEVRFVNPRAVAVKVHGSLAKFGNPRWVSLGDCRWRNHIDDPLLQQIAKARGERKVAA